MLRTRVIPVLLVRNRGLVKTRGFADDKYVGDPINAVRIFNEKQADELVLLDIDASAQRREPDYAMIAQIASECRMPLTYGGGITSVEQSKRIMGLGVEKVSLSTAAIARPELVSEIAEQAGAQSVAVVLDVRRLASGDYRVYVGNGLKDTGHCPIALGRTLQERGLGELMINSIDRDGMMKGYDLELAQRIRAAVDVPLTLIGGAGSLRDLTAAADACQGVGLGAGSLFVFKGTYRAVLINYPSKAERAGLRGMRAELD